MNGDLFDPPAGPPPDDRPKEAGPPPPDARARNAEPQGPQPPEDTRPLEGTRFPQPPPHTPGPAGGTGGSGGAVLASANLQDEDPTAPTGSGSREEAPSPAPSSSTPVEPEGDVRSPAAHGMGVLPPRELVLASAGTGKTYRISSRLIALLAHGAEPEHILASSFTRKAAGEILNRTLDRLAAAVLDHEEARKLADSAALAGAPAPPPDPAHWAHLLERLARRLHRLDVGTLDSYFIRAAQAFTHELRLPPGWSIADEAATQQLRAAVLQDLLGAIPGDELVELLRLVNRGSARRSVHESLLRHIDRLLAIAAQIDPDADDPWSAFERCGDSAPEPDEVERERLASIVEAFPAPQTPARARRAWGDTLARAAEALRLGDWFGFLDTKICEKIFDGAEKWYDCPLDPAREALAPVIAEVGRILRPRLAGQAKALGRLISRYADDLTRQQAATGLYRFDDITRLLGGPDPLAERPDLYYRLDGRTRHILLDEFQDTSFPQWEALQPLLDEVLSDEGRAGVIVADTKQSIYGWRGAEPVLVRHVGERYSLDSDLLDRSWRSSRVVLDFVNRVFDRIDERPSLGRQNVCIEAAKDWLRDFSPHRPVKDLPGYVRVEVGPKDEGRGQRRPKLCARTAERVAEIRRLAPGYSIGVLTRTNSAVARMILELRRQGLNPSGEGGNPLTDSAACEGILALLRLADHPGDTIARYHVAKTPIGRVVGFEDHTDHRAAANLARRIRRELVVEGYGRRINRLADELAPGCDARELRRLMQLVELAYDYEERATLRPGDFVRLVETERVEDPARADVRVMTVHQAKGLEFDIVVLPELDNDLYRPQWPPVFTYRPDTAGRITAVLPALNRALRAVYPEVEPAHDQLLASAIRDGLSIFYVALTRARYAVHVIIAPDRGAGPNSTLSPARLIREALVAPGEPLPRIEEGDVLYEEGDREWYRKVPPQSRPEGAKELEVPAGPVIGEVAGKDRETDETDPQGASDAATGSAETDRPGMAEAAAGTAPTIRLRRRPRARGLPRRTPSGLEGGAHVDVRALLRLETGEALRRGGILHAWLERIQWLSDGAPGPDELRSIARRTAPEITDREVDALVTEFDRWLSSEPLRSILDRSSYPAGATVATEVRFLHREDDGLLDGSIDRLVLTREGDAVVAAEIIDFKTDLIGGREDLLAQRIEHYRPQIAAYRRAVQAAYGLPPDRVTGKLVFLDAARTFTVTPDGSGAPAEPPPSAAAPPPGAPSDPSDPQLRLL